MIESTIRLATDVFDPCSNATSEPSAPSNQPSLLSTSNARPPTAFTTSRSHALRRSFARAWRAHRRSGRRFRRRNQRWPACSAAVRRRAGGQRWRARRRCAQARSSGSDARPQSLILLVATSAGRKSATAAAITRTCASGAVFGDRVMQLRCGGHVHHVDTRRAARPAVLPAMSVTSAPRCAATRANA